MGGCVCVCVCLRTLVLVLFVVTMNECANVRACVRVCVYEYAHPENSPTRVPRITLRLSGWQSKHGFASPPLII